MVISTQIEMKRLLKRQYVNAVTKSITSLVLASGLTIGIPLYFRSVKNPVDFVVNGLGFISSSLLCVYAYVSANEIKEYGGKLKMFTELEKDRFIKEQLISQETYLNQITQQYQTVNIEPEYYPEVPTALHHHTTLQNDTTIDIQESHAPLHDEQCTNALQPTTDLLCPECNSNDVKSNGSSRGKKRYLCNNCNKTFGV